jgi:hypothetical protein
MYSTQALPTNIKLGWKWLQSKTSKISNYKSKNLKDWLQHRHNLTYLDGEQGQGQ